MIPMISEMRHTNSYVILEVAYIIYFLCDTYDFIRGAYYSIRDSNEFMNDACGFPMLSL